MINSIVTSNFGSDIAKSNGVEVISTYTGFKNIANEIEKLEENKNFIF
jgi:phosphoglucomutase